jgi:hypothetical protein
MIFPIGYSTHEPAAFISGAVRTTVRRSGASHLN